MNVSTEIEKVLLSGDVAQCEQLLRLHMPEADAFDNLDICVMLMKHKAWPLLKLAVNLIPDRDVADLQYLAAVAGRHESLRAVRILLELAGSDFARVRTMHNFLKHAAWADNPTVLQEAVKLPVHPTNRFDLSTFVTEEALCNAAYHGRARMLSFACARLVATKRAWRKKALKNAAERSHMHCVKVLLVAAPELHVMKVFKVMDLYNAIQEDNTEKVHWLLFRPDVCAQNHAATIAQEASLKSERMVRAVMNHPAIRPQNMLLAQQSSCEVRRQRAAVRRSPLLLLRAATDSHRAGPRSTKNSTNPPVKRRRLLNRE